MASSSSPNKSRKPFTLFGILKFSKEIDIATFIALLISISAASYQIVSYFRGADVVVHPSNFVMFVADNFTHNDIEVRVGASMLYANRADPGYNAAIASEFIEFTIDGIPYRQVSQEIVFFSSEEHPPECPSIQRLNKIKDEIDRNTLIGWSFTTVSDKRIYNCQGKDQKLIVDNPKIPLRGVINGGSSENHEMFFVRANSRKCKKGQKIAGKNCEEVSNRLHWQHLIDKLKVGDHIEFRMGVVLFGGEERSSKCTVEVSSADIGFLRFAGWRMFPFCDPA